MKKMILLLILFLFPLNIYAYSNYIIPGGQSLGIDVETDGVMIVGFYKINGKYNKGSVKLTGGDYILKVNGTIVNDSLELTNLIEKYKDDGKVDITFKRGNDIKKTTLDLIEDDGKYKTGLYVKSSIVGIGTLSYLDPYSKKFGALGHEIVESNTSSHVEIKSGIIFDSKITGIDKSIPGVAGSKVANFDYSKNFGTINKNTIYGIFGNYVGNFNTDVLEIGSPKIGKAFIKTVIDNDEIKDYEIEIVRINEDSEIKNIYLKITNDDLIDKTGGIVQGMSGSPIIQDNKIVGVLTHVTVDNPIYGYGVFITKMLEEGDK